MARQRVGEIACHWGVGNLGQGSCMPLTGLQLGPEQRLCSRGARADMPSTYGNQPAYRQCSWSRVERWRALLRAVVQSMRSMLKAGQAELAELAQLAIHICLVNSA